MKNDVKYFVYITLHIIKLKDMSMKQKGRKKKTFVEGEFLVVEPY